VLVPRQTLAQDSSLLYYALILSDIALFFKRELLSNFVERCLSYLFLRRAAFFLFPKKGDDRKMDTVIQFRGTIYENGYGLIAQKVMRDKDLSPVAKSIYAYICSFAGVGKDGERSAFPGVQLMMNELGIKTEDTYYKHRKQLLEKGYITIEKQRQEGRFDKNIYYIEAVPVPLEIEKNIDTKGNEPHPKKSGTAPYPKKSSTAKSGTNSNSFNSNSFYKEEEENSSSELVSFLMSKDITPENAVKFETRLLEEGLTGYTHEQVIKAIEWSLQRFVKDKCDEPYIYAVGRLQRVLDGKVKDVINKPKNKTTKKRPDRMEKLPDWFEEETNSNPVAGASGQTQEEKKQEIEDMLKRLRA